MSEDDKLINLIFDSTRSVTGDGVHELHVPDLDENDKLSVSKCVEIGYVSSIGSEITVFENKIKDYTRCQHAIAVNSGTSALHLTLLAAGVNSNHEVLLPSLTFVATGNAVLYTGASPHFIESCEKNLGIDLQKLKDHLHNNTSKSPNGETINLKTGKVIKALIVVHIFGHMHDMYEIQQICDDFNLMMIEDAAEALGSFFSDVHAGCFGLCGAISFNGNKIITTGGGGCVITNDENVARKIRHLSTTAKIAHQFEYSHDQIGFNYRMPNLNAALGVSQLRRLPQFLEKKAALLQAYQTSFSQVSGIAVYEHNKKLGSNYWLQTILLKKANKSLRDTLLKRAHDNGLKMRPVWQPLHELPAFYNSYRMALRKTEDIALRLINLPSSCYLIK